MNDEIKQAVKDKYAGLARGSSSNETTQAIAEAFGYSLDELHSIPTEANLGVSCGNPTAMASIRIGEVVVDLGSGGGLDVFLASQKVGPTGKAIGIDMTPDMIARARRNAENGGYANVEFHLAEIEALPLDDGSIDCIISNCVLNLVPDKPKAFDEIHRVLRPGGRLAVSDIALKKSLPEELADDLMAYVGCISGAILIEEYQQGLLQAGFTHVEIVDSGADLNAYAKADNQSGCCTPQMVPSPGGLDVIGQECCSATDDGDLLLRLAELLKRHDVNDYAASVKVFAVKPA